MAEWLKAHAWKACKGVILSWVRSHSLRQIIFCKFYVKKIHYKKKFIL